MKEKLLAQRQAAEAGTEAPAAKAAPAKRATTSRSSTRGSAGSSRAGASKASTGKREVHRSAHVGGKGDKHQAKSPLPVIVGIVVVLLMIVGGFLFKDTLFGSDDPANASESTASNEGEGAESATESEADASTDASTENAGDDGEDAADAGDEVATDDEEPPAEEDDGPPRGHPDSVDLSQLPDIEPFGDTTDEEWTQMNEWMTTFINDSSARGNRAGNSLKAMHRKALPVIMNQFKTLDFGEQEDVNTGDVVQRMLTEICGGKNYTWKYDTEDSSHFFNKRVVEMWQGLIVDQALASELAWAGILKVDISELPDPIGGADAADSTPGFTPPDFGGLDDIDD